MSYQFLKTNWHPQTENLNLFKLFEKRNQSIEDLWVENKSNKCKNRPVHNEEKILMQLHSDSQKEDFYSLYIHTKGVKKSITNPEKNKYIRDWLDYLLYFNVYKYKLNLNELKYFDTCGVSLRQSYPSKSWFYAGNFWWTKSSHLRKIKGEIERDYLGPELWLLQNENTDMVSLWQSEINHNENRYLKNNYINKEIHKYKIIRRSHEHR